MPDLRLDYVPREDATPEAEIRTLAEVYRFVLDCSEKQSPAHRDNGEGTDREGDRG